MVVNVDEESRATKSEKNSVADVLRGVSLSPSQFQFKRNGKSEIFPIPHSRLRPPVSCIANDTLSQGCVCFLLQMGTQEAGLKYTKKEK
jgi:hypothetical protein